MTTTEAASDPLRAENRPLEVWLVRPTMGQGGADRVTATLLRSLDRELFRPSLVLMRSEGELLAEVPGDVSIHDLGGRRLWTAWWPLARRLRHHSPRILFSTSSGTNLIAVIARFLCGRRMRLVLSERNALSRPEKRFRRWLQLLLKRRLYPLADCVTAVSKGVADDLVSRLAIPPEQIRVVCNPVVTPDLTSLAAAGVEHPWFGEKDPILLGVGRLVPTKRFDLLIMLLARIRTSRPPRLILLGEGSEGAALATLARDLVVEDRVWFAGFDPNPFRYMARCTVFVLSSRNEGLPGALIQAMACGAAVLSTDCDHGPAEIIDNGVNGLLVPVDDLPALVAETERLLDDPGLRTYLGRAARQGAQRFSQAAALVGYAEALLGESVTDPDTP